MELQGKRCRQAAYTLALKNSDEKNYALKKIRESLLSHIDEILEENKKDICLAKENGRNDSFIDRLSLNEKRIVDICDGITQVMNLEDPCSKILEEWDRGDLHLVKKSVPIGVIGIIYEARPNVSVDAAVLCLKSGNVCYLRGSKETLHTNKKLLQCL